MVPSATFATSDIRFSTPTTATRPSTRGLSLRLVPNPNNNPQKHLCREASGTLGIVELHPYARRENAVRQGFKTPLEGCYDVFRERRHSRILQPLVRTRQQIPTGSRRRTRPVRLLPLIHRT